MHTNSLSTINSTEGLSRLQSLVPIQHFPDIAKCLVLILIRAGTGWRDACDSEKEVPPHLLSIGGLGSVVFLSGRHIIGVATFFMSMEWKRPWGRKMRFLKEQRR